MHSPVRTSPRRLAALGVRRPRLPARARLPTRASSDQPKNLRFELPHVPATTVGQGGAISTRERERPQKSKCQGLPERWLQEAWGAAWLRRGCLANPSGRSMLSRLSQDARGGASLCAWWLVRPVLRGRVRAKVLAKVGCMGSYQREASQRGSGRDILSAQGSGAASPGAAARQHDLGAPAPGPRRRGRSRCPSHRSKDWACTTRTPLRRAEVCGPACPIPALAIAARARSRWVSCSGPGLRASPTRQPFQGSLPARSSRQAPRPTEPAAARLQMMAPSFLSLYPYPVILLFYYLLSVFCLQ